MARMKGDDSVFAMLEAEATRCRRVIERLSAELEGLPRGTLGERKIKSAAGREYVYPCLRFRKEGKVVFEHISAEKAEKLRPLFVRKKKLLIDMKANKVRLRTIEGILRARHKA